MIMQTEECFLNLIVMQELAGLPRILTRNHIHTFKCLECPQRNIFQIPNRRRYHKERSAH